MERVKGLHTPTCNNQLEGKSLMFPARLTHGTLPRARLLKAQVLNVGCPSLIVPLDETSPPLHSLQIACSQTNIRP